MNWSALQAIALSLCPSADCAELPIRPVAASQELLTRWIETTGNAHAKEHWALLAELRNNAKNDDVQFVRQLAYFVHTHRDTYDAALIHAYALIGYCQVSKSAVAKGLGPYVYTTDEALREVVRVPFLVERGPYRHPDYSHYRQLALGEDRNHEAAEPMRRMMFEFSPNAAFLLYHTEPGGQQMMELRRMERLIADALYEKSHLGGLPGGKIDEDTASVIRRLGESEHWWARMFAAEIMVQNKEFRDPEVIQRLLKDENNLVRQSVASIKTPDPLRFAKVDE
jgi:hypothetical protein